jgi:hypothetical protein
MIYIFIYIFILIILTVFSTKESFSVPLREFKNMNSLEQSNRDELEYIGLTRTRSKAFMKKILAQLVKKVPTNSVDPGGRCTAGKHIQCKGDSVCYSRGKGRNPICTAGVDGMNPVGQLTEANMYGNYHNGNIQYFPRDIEGCYNSGFKCPPKFKCAPQYDACLEMEKIRPEIKVKKVDSTRLEFQPPYPIEAKFTCPEKHDIFEKKQAQFCKHEKTKKECALEPGKNDGKPLCSTIQCPLGYFQLVPGICENDERKTCSLEPNPDHPLCGGRNDFIKIENINIPHNEINKFSKFSEKECASECLNNLECDSFTYNKVKNLCSLKKNTGEASNKLDENDNYNLFIKTPINYTLYDKSDIVGYDLKKYTNKSYLECANECDENNECLAFVSNNDKDFSTCELKSSYSNSKFKLNKNIFKKNDFSGSLCPTIKLDKVETKIKNTISRLKTKYQLELDKKIDELSKKSISNIKKNNKIVEKKFLKKLSNEHDILIINSINIDSNKIKIEKLDKLYLHMSILQIWGKPKNNENVFDFIQNKKTIINMSSIYDDHSNEFCKDYNLNTFMSTNYDNKTNQYIEIILPELITISKIIIFNKSGKNKDKLIPFKIGLYTNDILQHYYIKESFNTNFIESKRFNIKPNIKVKDYGDYTKFRTTANIDGLGDYNYCRFVNINDKEQFSCTGSNGDYEFMYDIKTPYDNSYFKHKNGSGSDDLCRCTGIPSKSKITCTDNNNNDYTLTSLPNCDKLSGEEISDILKTDSKSKFCKNFIHFKVDCGFYWKKTSTYYLFRNTIINNNKVILFTKLDSNTLKIQRGYPKIVNKNTWNNLSLLHKIDSVFLINENEIVFTSDKIYVKFDMQKFKQLPNYPKNIKDNFQDIPQTFHNISTGIYIKNNNLLLFNKFKSIDFNPNQIEMKSDENIDTISNINYNLKNIYPNINIEEWNTLIYNYDLNNLIIFCNEFIYIYDTLNSNITHSIDIKKDFASLWTFNINSL